MAGIMFVIRVPTEAEERRICGEDVDKSPKVVLNAAGVGIVITPVQSHQVAEKADNFSPQNLMPPSELPNTKAAFVPTPKSAITNKRQSESKEVLVEIEHNSGGGEHDNHAISSSIDDFRIGMMMSPNVEEQPKMKRTLSHNNIKDSNDDEALPSITSNKLEPNSSMRKSWDGYLKDLVTSAKKTKPVKEPDLNIESTAAMETVVREILKKMKLRVALWQTSDDKDYVQISVSVEAGFVQERLLTMLSEWGIGEREGSSISMVPCTLFSHKPPVETVHGDGTPDDQEILDKNAGAWDRFMNSMRARLNVAQIVESVKQDATITFDFLSLLIIAALLAAFGLVEDSTIFLASSMLISPLMGPIIAATFGTVIKDPSLTKFGIINELIGILITTMVGFFFGLIFFNVSESFSKGDGITDEMRARCEIHSLVVGIFIAIPSGAAVAISILGENIGSLVGVAISASLLPPAVNSGLVWALATMFMFHQRDDSKYNIVIHTNEWSNHQAVELFVMGSISMAVTISNVICVYAAGSLFLKIKEVSPIVSRDQRQFWKHDVKLARDFNNKSGAASVNESGSMTQKWADEFGDFQTISDADRIGLNSEVLRNIGRPAYQQTWSPMTYRHQFQAQAEPKMSIGDIEHMYLNMAHPLNQNSQFKRHYSMSGPGSSKTVMYRRSSPPKYRSLVHDHIFATAQQRRSSMPYYSSSPPAPVGNFFKRSEENRLGNIQEVSSITSVADTSSLGRSIDRRSSSASGRKFIVTPANDDSLKK